MPKGASRNTEPYEPGMLPPEALDALSALSAPQDLGGSDVGQ